VVPELGGTTTVVALDGGGLLLTQPESITPKISNPDTTFILISWFNRHWPSSESIVDWLGGAAHRLYTRV
jgi:hypothetical protein